MMNAVKLALQVIGANASLVHCIGGLITMMIVIRKSVVIVRGP